MSVFLILKLNLLFPQNSLPIYLYSFWNLKKILDDNSVETLKKQFSKIIFYSHILMTWFPKRYFIFLYICITSTFIHTNALFKYKILQL